MAIGDFYLKLSLECGLSGAYTVSSKQLYHQAKVIVKALLIAAVTAFNFAVMPWCTWTDQFVLYSILNTELVQDMYSWGLDKIGEFNSVVRLDNFRGVYYSDSRK